MGVRLVRITFLIPAGVRIVLCHGCHGCLGCHPPACDSLLYMIDQEPFPEVLRGRGMGLNVSSLLFLNELLRLGKLRIWERQMEVKAEEAWSIQA